MRRGWVSGSIWIILLIGCGKGASHNTAHLGGAISIGGKPLPDDAEGTMQFMPTQPGQATPTSAPIVGSSYDASQVPKGKVNVIFNIKRPTGRMVREDNVPTASPYPELQDLVPKKHRAGIGIEVSEDNHGLDFEL